MKKKYVFLIISLFLLIISILYIIVIKNVDVRTIGPNNTSVGLSTINESFHKVFGYNDILYKLTKYLGVVPILLVVMYALIGLYELIQKKSLFKVNKKLILLGCFYVVVLLVYILFEKLAINYRPVIIDGELEASFPSSHTILALCFCGSSLLTSKYFITNLKTKKYIDTISLIVMILIVVGRTLSGVHWFTDIIGGIIISLFLLSVLYTGILFLNERKKSSFI
ncbi:MAG: phosphatase PAP2 family protein [Bacilli bacterium]|nr:phosphatase PAP2 family protein [Bacilli bacterium]